MLLQSLEIQNSRGERVNLPLEAPQGWFYVRSIEGLGPVQAELVSGTFANADGERFYAGRRVKRNIIIRLGIDADYSVESAHDLRSYLYRRLMPKNPVSLYFTMQDYFNANIVESQFKTVIEGRIESMAPSIFTKQPALDISVVCFDPNFCALAKTTFNGSTESAGVESELDYPGTTETGAVFKLISDRTIDDLAIYHRTPDDKLRPMFVDASIFDGDMLTIDSNRGQKTAMLRQGGVERSILDKVSGHWLELDSGVSGIRAYSFGDPVPYTIEYVAKYGGL